MGWWGEEWDGIGWGVGGWRRRERGRQCWRVLPCTHTCQPARAGHAARPHSPPPQPCSAHYHQQKSPRRSCKQRPPPAAHLVGVGRLALLAPLLPKEHALPHRRARGRGQRLHLCVLSVRSAEHHAIGLDAAHVAGLQVGQDQHHAVLYLRVGGVAQQDFDVNGAGQQGEAGCTSGHQRGRGRRRALRRAPPPPCMGCPS